MDDLNFNNISTGPEGDGCFKSFLVIGGGFAVLITVLTIAKYLLGM